MVLLVLLLLIFSISIVGFSLYTGISPMPSSRNATRIMALSLPKNSQNIYELGSGWGGLAIYLARKHPLARCHAIEISPLPWIVSVALQRIRQCSNLKIRRKNFFLLSLAEADVVVCYLYPGAMLKLKTKFERELKQGSWVISNSFAVPGWVPANTVQINDIWGSKIFIYQFEVKKI